MDGGAGDGNGHKALGGVHRRKPTKKTKQPNKMSKPIKVVYISNPMKVQTSASKFMALVQQLTGQDAEFPDPSKFHSSAACGGAPTYLLDNPAAAADDDGNPVMNYDSPSSLSAELPAEDNFLGSYYDDFDDLIFSPPVIGNFAGLVLPAAICESYAR